MGDYGLPDEPCCTVWDWVEMAIIYFFAVACVFGFLPAPAVLRIVSLVLTVGVILVTITTDIFSRYGWAAVVIVFFYILGWIYLLSLVAYVLYRLPGVIMHG